MADDAIEYMKRLERGESLAQPFFLYYVPGGTHAPHHPTPEWTKKISDMHLFDKGWDDLREQIFVKQKKLEVIPPDAKMTPWPSDLLKHWNHRRLRATAQDRQMAQAIGIRTSAVIAATFGFGTALAGVAGALLANQFFVYPTGGIPLSVYAYIAVVVGGWGSIPGAVIGAMMISVFQVVVSAYVSYAVATGLLYVALLLIFFFRPQGIFGELVQRRV